MRFARTIRLVLLCGSMVAAIVPAQAGAHTVVESVPGSILDVSSTKLLYLSGSELRIRDRATDIDEAITGVPSSTPPSYGYLSPHGAIFEVSTPAGSNSMVFEWRDGTLIDLGPLNSAFSLRAAGDFAIWNNQTTLYRRDLSTGTTITVSTQAGNIDNDVAANGTVAFFGRPPGNSNYNVFLYHPDGTTEPITNSSTEFNVFPLTDGTNVAYVLTTFGANDGSVMVHYAGASNLALDSYRGSGAPHKEVDYRIANGWVAYTRPNASGQLQVWRHSPAGGPDEQVSPGTGGATLVALNDIGEVLTSAGNKTYITAPGGSPIQIADFALSSSTPAVWLDGSWYVALGGDLIRIDMSQRFADLTITNTHSPEPVRIGNDVTWTIQVRNLGPSAANRASMTDKFLNTRFTFRQATTTQGACTNQNEGNQTSVTCFFGTLAPGSVVTITIRATAILAGSGGGFFNIATVQGFEVDPDTISNRQDSNPTVVYPPYVRPKSATPLYVPLVLAYEQCFAGSATAAHSPPLSNQSCLGTRQDSPYVTVGTFDANRVPVKSEGHVRFRAILDDTSTPADEADVALELFVSDVRRQNDLSDYTGDLLASTSVRITDKNNSVTATEYPDATMRDYTFSFAAPCTATDSVDGSDCGVNTTADSLVPGIVVEGKRAIWQMDRIEVYDGGSDEDVSTPGNSLFETQGVFAP